jgi:deoxyribose-phosphate aldolase
MSLSDESLAALIDHTLLSPGCTLADAKRVCAETARYRFAAVVVPPYFVPFAVTEMASSGIPVCSVVSFPHGWDPPAVKCDQARLLVEMGAAEIDMVMNVSAFLSGRADSIEEEVAAVREVCGRDAVLKVILETAYLGSDQIAMAARMTAGAGADIVKTSTGFAPRGATLEDIRIIKKAVGGSAGIKAAGGIRTRDQACALINAGATRLGCSASVDVIKKGGEGTGAGSSSNG